jgi:toxin ParE1/3/4
MKLVYSPRAVRDLAAIGDYLRERSPSGAGAVESRIKTTIDVLAAFPESGRALAQRPPMPVVRCPYLVFYTVVADDLLILHIRHGARETIAPEEL